MAAKWRKRSNLQSFLNHTTPTVPSYPLPKACLRELNTLWQPIFHDKVVYFSLGDLWDQYREWSAYGAGVPIILNNCESIVQYYVPYLSAIQIYTSKSLAPSRIVLEESESESQSDDSESEKLSRSWDAASEDSVPGQDGSMSSRALLGKLYLQYIEYGSPYERIPLMDKVNELAWNYPSLTSFKSVDISPASWMSVAWYPIYHIPTCRNLKDLSACFLTYHTMSASFQDDNVAELVEAAKDLCCTAERNLKMRKRGNNCMISISPFGLATYKLQGRLWRNPETSDDEMISTLYSSAYCWLRQLGVEQHDFNFFTTH